MLIDSKRYFYFISAIIILALLSIVMYQKYQISLGKNVVTIVTGAGSVKIDVEYADTPEKQTKGLMNRATLGKLSGMLFIFPEEKTRSFWMKNVVFPIDVMFISSNGRINETTTLEPCPKDADACPTYDSKESAQYVIEVNAGFTQKNKIIEGDILEISGF